MRSRPQKQIIQEVETEEEDVAVEEKNEGFSMPASKKNTILIVVASVILIFVCYYIFFSGLGSQQPILEPVSAIPDVIEKDKIDKTNLTAENENKEDEKDSSIYDLKEIDKKEKNDVELLEKQEKPAIPDLLKTVVFFSRKFRETAAKLKSESEDNSKIDPNLPNAVPDSIVNKSSQNTASSEDLKMRDQKIQELELKLKEQQENQEREKKSLMEELKKSNQENPVSSEKVQESVNTETILEPRYSPIVVFSDRREGSPPIGVGEEKNIIVLKEDDIKKIAKTEKNIEVKMIEDRSRTIAQGKLLSAILETAINTEFPGPVRGIITRDVYGEAGKEVLIPKGSRLYGTYSAEIKRGQGRVNISWSRLLRPDGISLGISLSASDQSGRAGIPGEADNRYSSLVANSLLASVLAVAGTAAAQQVMGGNTQTSTTINASQGTTTTFGNAGNQALADVTKTIIDIVTGIIKNTIDLNPVIRVPQGTRMTVIVNNDIVVPYMKKSSNRNNFK